MPCNILIEHDFKFNEFLYKDYASRSVSSLIKEALNYLQIYFSDRYKLETPLNPTNAISTRLLVSADVHKGSIGRMMRVERLIDYRETLPSDRGSRYVHPRRLSSYLIYLVTRPYLGNP